MKLIRIIDQMRRDFTGEYKCENCLKKIIMHGCYDDDYFHEHVTPKWKCEDCGKSSKDLGIENKVTTRYQSHEVV